MLDHSHYTSLILPAKIPAFRRISWVSEEAQHVWMPKVQLIEKALIELSFLRVKEGLKNTVIKTIPAYLYLNISSLKEKYGLETVLIGSSTIRSGTGNRIFHKVKITQPGNKKDSLFLREHKGEKTQKIMNIPECCREAYACLKQLELIDWLPLITTEKENSVTDNNYLLARYGLSPLSHIPCSNKCSQSKEIQSKERKLLSKISEDASQSLKELLSWPTLWSNLHGLVEIKNPIFRIIMNGDNLKEKVEIKYQGNAYPKEGATGIRFPFKVRNKSC